MTVNDDQGRMRCLKAMRCDAMLCDVMRSRNVDSETGSCRTDVGYRSLESEGQRMGKTMLVKVIDVEIGCVGA